METKIPQIRTLAEAINTYLGKNPFKIIEGVITVEDLGPSPDQSGNYSVRRTYNINGFDPISTYNRYPQRCHITQLIHDARESISGNVFPSVIESFGLTASGLEIKIRTRRPEDTKRDDGEIQRTD